MELSFVYVELQVTAPCHPGAPQKHLQGSRLFSCSAAIMIKLGSAKKSNNNNVNMIITSQVYFERYDNA